eukprot:TRINITY_DN11287_c0_g1_i3.p1 TRINITY_DN11287_c0_g1~~TRINITY_DN11287_c0_g1_i3.p1  ORF type:complete len:1100 (+),score=387.15 TRINITY_DN11287_c0_g1_i3:87-3386(+)
MSFGRQTAGRFERDAVKNTPGPGAYDVVPSTLDTSTAEDDCLSGISSVDTTAGVPASSGSKTPRTTSVGNHSMSTGSLHGELSVSRASSRQGGVSQEKENRLPLSHRASLGAKKAGHRAQSPEVASAASLNDMERRSHQKLCQELNQVDDELTKRKKEAQMLRQQVTSKDRKMDELHRKLEAAEAERRKIFQRAIEAESYCEGKQKLLVSKEQELLALQRKNEHLQRAVEDRTKKLEHRQQDFMAVSRKNDQLQHLASTAALEERLTTAAVGRKAKEEEVKHLQEKLRQQDQNQRDQLCSLEESLRKEVARRCDAEQQAARWSDELDAERSRCEALQARLDAKAEQIVRLEEGKKGEQNAREQELQAKLEESEAKSSAALAELRALQDSISCKDEESTKRLQEEVTRAEKMKMRVIELEETAVHHRLASGEALHSSRDSLVRSLEDDVNSLKIQVEERTQELELSARQVRRLEQELKEEQQRSEQLERVASQLEQTGVQRLFVEDEEKRHAEQVQTDLEVRLREAKERSEAAAEEVQRWKEWGEEHTLREIERHSEHLEELKRVRKELNDHYEEAKREVVQKNAALEKELERLRQQQEASLEAARLEELEVLTAQQMEESQERDRREHALQREKAQLEIQLQGAQSEVECFKAELAALQKQLDREARKAKDELAALDTQVRRLQAELGEAEDRLEEERERHEGEAHALRRAFETSARAKAEEYDSALSETRQVASQQEASFAEELQFRQTTLLETRWQVLVVAAMQSQRVEEASVHICHVRSRAIRWRSSAIDQTSNEAALQKQETELQTLLEEVDELRGQNKQLLLSLQQAQAEQHSESSELRRLREVELTYEREVLRISHLSAELAGHQNHKQKIRHLENLKQDNETLREEIKKSRKMQSQLETQLRSAHFFDGVIGDHAASAGPRSPPTLRANAHVGGASRAAINPRSPGRERCSSLSVGAAAVIAEDFAACGQSVSSTPARVRRERLEADRRAQASERALERVVTEYQHLAVLVESVLASGVSGLISGGLGKSLGPAASGAVTPEASVAASESSALSSKAPCESLLRRLRELSASLSRPDRQSCADDNVEVSPTP